MKRKKTKITILSEPFPKHKYMPAHFPGLVHESGHDNRIYKAYNCVPVSSESEVYDLIGNSWKRPGENECVMVNTSSPSSHLVFNIFQLLCTTSSLNMTAAANLQRHLFKPNPQ
jgi:hypothetical protein